VSRVQLALNVSDINEAIAFYSKMFNTEPAKVREGYANFAIADPPLKLVLIENAVAERLNHLGIEVESTDEVAEATNRFDQIGLTTDVEEQTTCCYAVQDKVWVRDPDDARWEVYTVISDSVVFGLAPVDGGDVCCATSSPAEPVSLATKPGCC
jgi:catechol 2,3-dioxygenase-like lactoylglutathione lyase family enzyme